MSCQSNNHFLSFLLLDAESSIPGQKSLVFICTILFILFVYTIVLPPPRELCVPSISTFWFLHYQGRKFIDLWKSMYDMFVMHEDEQRIYHCIATVGTLLLQIGELGAIVQNLEEMELYDDNHSTRSQSLPVELSPKAELPEPKSPDSIDSNNMSILIRSKSVSKA
ncbi:uncharacterized protein CEXT_348461 [Caerostris extrusa]|uniref:Uncharacterized protein n=1 Tax=Caerostris extrusa TaxID=172846 RepID=A0AAV4TVG6_CAEEX|nr:uncharacterized protein CEXT_348461 [Caerostris extrusa]